MLCGNGIIFAPLSWKRGVLGERPGDFWFIGTSYWVFGVLHLFLHLFFLPGLVLVFLFRILSGFLLGFLFPGFLGEFIDILRRYYIWGNMITGNFSLSIPMVIGLRIFFWDGKKDIFTTKSLILAQDER